MIVQPFPWILSERNLDRLQLTQNCRMKKGVPPRESPGSYIGSEAPNGRQFPRPETPTLRAFMKASGPRTYQRLGQDANSSWMPCN